jgi:DNA repair exonuclease SbcCD ATPase subunit
VIRREPDLLHPRLTVVPVDVGPRRALDRGAGRTIVGRAELEAATQAVAGRKRTARLEELAARNADLEAALDRLGEARTAVDQRLADHDGFLSAADWCTSLPDLAAAHRSDLAAAEAELSEALRAARDASRALDRVLEQRAQADAAITEARRQLHALDRGEGDPGGERAQAAAALSAQAESLEARLSEAEREARSRSEETKRAVTAIEHTIERLVREQRDRQSRLRALVDCLPGDARPPHDDDPLHHVDTVSAGLRGLAETIAAELTGLRAALDRHRAECEHRRSEVAAIRATLDRTSPDDAAEALADLLAGVADGVVVLDDVVATDPAGTDDGLLRALEAAEPEAPLVLLSSDPTVLGWAIDLPAERGALVGPRTVDLLDASASTTRLTAAAHDVAPAHAVTSSTGDPR